MPANYDDIFERLVGGRYRVARRLGAGAFGEVFEAAHEVFGVPLRTVALKLFTSEYVTSGTRAAIVFHEALVLERLASGARARGEPVHLVTVHDMGVLDDYGQVPYVAMELVDSSLERELQRSPSLGVGPMVRHVRAICAGLRLLHGASPALIHRDLKPGNVLIMKNGFVKVADFGLAIDRHQAFLHGGPAGTVSYAAPENRDGGRATPAFDVYSLGIMMLEMLLQRQPVQRHLARAGGDPKQRERALLEAQRRLADLRDPETDRPFTEELIELRRSVPLQEVLRRCLCLDPADRYTDARVLDRDLAELDRGAVPEAPLPDAEPDPPREGLGGEEEVQHLLARAEKRLRFEDYGEAERLLLEVKRRDMRRPEVYFGLSLVYEGRDRARALAVQSEAVKLARYSRKRPLRVEDLSRLADLHERAGDMSSARAVREEAAVLGRRAGA